jgi:hypothetical protein
MDSRILSSGITETIPGFYWDKPLVPRDHDKQTSTTNPTTTMNLLKPIGLGLLLLGTSWGSFSGAQSVGGEGHDVLSPVACGEAGVITDTDDYAGGSVALYTIIFPGPNPDDDSAIQEMYDARYELLLILLEFWATDGLCFVAPDTCKVGETCYPILEEWGTFYVEGPDIFPDGTAGWTLYFEGLFGWHCTPCVKEIV